VIETLNLSKMANFKTPNGDFHLIDNAGNHFVNRKCVNPKTTDSPEYGHIGATHPEESLRTTLPEVTGKVPYLIDDEGRFIRL
jgi:hypothetical protein